MRAFAKRRRSTLRTAHSKSLSDLENPEPGCRFAQQSHRRQ